MEPLLQVHLRPQHKALLQLKANVTGTCPTGILSGNSYTTGAITANCTVIANFAINTYTVTPSAGSGGSINPNTPQTVNYNSTIAFTVTPNAGYHIASVTGCGGSLNGNTYTTGSITANCNVSATFSINTSTYTVSTSAGSGGTITPASQTVVQGATASFTVTANNGYFIVSVTGCGGLLSGNTYTTAPVTANCTVSATFTTTNGTIPTGNDIPVSPRPETDLTFDNVTSGGIVTVTPIANPTPLSNFRIVGGQSYDITFTGTFTGSVTVCIEYNDADVHGNENNLKLFHLENTGWRDITTTRNTSANIICGETTSFSEFAVMESTSPTPVGYDFKWLIATLISLILIGGYLLRKRRKV
ncbi:MAG: hypothetical protein HY755_10285 [Nitrospirae bacterium]|nr:hypothetical protein [Nitrospirota bacterium]